MAYSRYRRSYRRSYRAGYRRPRYSGRFYRSSASSRRSRMEGVPLTQVFGPPDAWEPWQVNVLQGLTTGITTYALQNTPFGLQGLA